MYDLVKSKNHEQSENKMLDLDYDAIKQMSQLTFQMPTPVAPKPKQVSSIPKASTPKVSVPKVYKPKPLIHDSPITSMRRNYVQSQNFGKDSGRLRTVHSVEKYIKENEFSYSIPILSEKLHKLLHLEETDPKIRYYVNEFYATRQMSPLLQYVKRVSNIS